MPARPPLVAVTGQLQQLPQTDWVQAQTWYGLVAGAYGSGDPAQLMALVQQGGVIAPTPTNVGTSVARLSFFRLPFDLVVNKIRFYGVGATSAIFQVAIYRWSDLARLTAQLAMTTVASTWGAAGSALALTLTKDTLYFLACSVNTTGTTAGPAAFGTTIATTTGQIATAPASLPGNLAAGAALLGYQAQMTVSSGALPNPAVAGNIVAQAAWTGGMPAFWLDNSNA